MDLMSLLIASAVILVAVLGGIGIGMVAGQFIGKLFNLDLKKQQLLSTIIMCIFAVITTRIAKTMLLSRGFPNETLTLSFVIAGILGIPLVILLFRKNK